jgi:hypothetical protein
MRTLAPALDAAESAQAKHDEAGMSTAEYCVGTVSACGFGGMLYTILTSDWAQNFLQSIFGKITDLLPF